MNFSFAIGNWRLDERGLFHLHWHCSRLFPKKYKWQHYTLLAECNENVNNIMSITCEPPVKGMQTHPMGLPMMMGAWFSCVVWAAEQEDTLAMFKADTGLDLAGILRRTPLEAMIDKSTGFEQHIVASFCDWVTKTIWGEEEEENPTAEKTAETNPG